MRITNRSGKPIDYMTFKDNDTTQTLPLKAGHIGVNDTVDQPQGEHQVLIRIMQRDMGQAEGSGPFLNTGHVIITFQAPEWTVDWGDVLARHTKDAQAVSARAARGNPALEQAMRVGSALISALVTALGSKTPVAGVVEMLGWVVTESLTQDEGKPVPPPNVRDIEKAVERVVERVVQRITEQDAAKDCAATFLLTHEWLASTAKLFAAAQGRSRATLGTVEEVFKTDFPQRFSDLERCINKMRTNPQMARWIIAPLLSGLNAHLQMYRFKAMLDYEKTSDLRSELIQLYMREVGACRDALIATGRAWQAHLDGLAEREHLGGTPEGEKLKRITSAAYTGREWVGPYFSPVDDMTPAVGVLGEAINEYDKLTALLQTDLDNIGKEGYISHYLPTSKG